MKYIISIDNQELVRKSAPEELICKLERQKEIKPKDTFEILYSINKQFSIQSAEFKRQMKQNEKLN